MEKYEKQFRTYLEDCNYNNYIHEPKEYNHPPDFKVFRPGGNILCEVKTIAKDSEAQTKEEILAGVRDRLKELGSSYHYSLFDPDPKLNQKDSKKFVNFIEYYLDNTQIRSEELPIKFVYSGKEIQDTREFREILIPDREDCDFNRIVSIKNDNKNYPLDAKKLHLPYEIKLKLRTKSGRVKKCTGTSLKIWEKPNLELNLFAPNEEEDEMHMISSGASFSPDYIDKIRRKIDKGYKKFRHTSKLPGVLVLYVDYVIDLDWFAIKTAILGDAKIAKLNDGSFSSLFHQGNSQFQRKKYRHLSAVAFLDPLDNGEERYTVLHHPWCYFPLNKEFFKGKFDRQFFQRLDCFGYCEKGKSK